MQSPIYCITYFESYLKSISVYSFYILFKSIDELYYPQSAYLLKFNKY